MEWVAIPSSRGSSQPRDRIQVSHITCRFSTTWVTREVARQWYYSIPKSWKGGEEWGDGISHVFYNPAEVLLHLVFTLRPRLTTDVTWWCPLSLLLLLLLSLCSPVSDRNVKSDLNIFLYWKVFPVVMHGFESWTIRKAEHLRIDVFELWCWRRPLRVPWTARRSNQSILEEINPDIHWKDWWWSWNSNTLATSCKEPTYWKIPWCWERLKVKGEEGSRGWNGYITSLTQWTWTWANSGR